MAPDNAQVRVPPPLFFALAVLGGFLLNRRWPMPIGDGRWVEGLAAVLVVAWVGLAASSIGMFRRSRTSIVPIRPATALVVSGPYRFTRNPMYLSLAALTVALALVMNTWWPVLLLVPVLFTIQRFVIAREEAYLGRRFGAEYLAYSRRVRRWV
jgi:protein-S-isoprenylcysteine O-methyltransferase Ste14